MVSSSPFQGPLPWRLGPWPLAAKRGWRRVWRVIEAWSALETGRFILLAPWLIALGILLWLARPGMVPLAPVGLVAGLALAAWLIALREGRIGVALVARAAGLVVFGMALIAARTAWVAAPVIPSGFAVAEITGSIERLERRERDRRYTIRVDHIEGLSPQAAPRRVRIVWRGEPGSAGAGDQVTIRAQLSPPPGPALPGGYDFSRQMFYQGIGGAGFAYAPPTVINARSRPLRIENLRERIADRVQAVVEGPEGAVAAALITGKRERIPGATVDALRDAGLAHMLAISGLHMGLVCGFLFWTARFLLTRSEALTLRFPVKKWAAIVALVGGGAYLALSGGAWSAQRAYIMAAVVFGAMLVDRQGLSLRNVAIAALIILIWRPEAVASPGFQMSFAAVAVLIAAFSALERRASRDEAPSWIDRTLSMLKSLLLTSLLAGFATGPFAAYHFGRIATFGLLGNMLTMPIFTLAVMPALVLAVFLMPVGCDAPVLIIVGWGLRVILGIAQWTSDLPGAIGHVAQLAPAGLVAASAGLIIVTMLEAPWRLAGLGLIALSWPLSGGNVPPDLLMSRNLKNIAVRQHDGAPLAVLSTRRDKFSLEAWLQALGHEADLGKLDRLGGCDDGPCSHPLYPATVIPDRSFLTDACRSARVVVLRAEGLPGDADRCAALLIAQDTEGQHPPASLRFEGGQPVLLKAEAYSTAF